MTKERRASAAAAADEADAGGADRQQVGADRHRADDQDRAAGDHAEGGDHRGDVDQRQVAGQRPRVGARLAHHLDPGEAVDAAVAAEVAVLRRDHVDLGQHVVLDRDPELVDRLDQPVGGGRLDVGDEDVGARSRPPSSGCWITRRTPSRSRSSAPELARPRWMGERAGAAASASVGTQADQLHDLERLSPFGVSTSTVEPTLASISARPIGDSAESRPSARFASVEPTRVQALVSPLDSSRTSAVRPKVKVSPSMLVDLDHDRVAQPFLQPLDPRLHVRLVLFGDVILGVLLEVALLAGDLDPRRHLLAVRALRARPARLSAPRSRRR